MTDKPAFESAKIISDKKVCICTHDGRVHQRRFKGGRFTFKGDAYELKFGELVKVAPCRAT